MIKRFARAFHDSLNRWDTAFKTFANFLLNCRTSPSNSKDMATHPRKPRDDLLNGRGENSGSTPIFRSDGFPCDVQVEELNTALTSASKVFQES